MPMGRLDGATSRLADTGFGQFHGDAQVDFAQNRVQAGIAGLLAQPLGCDLEARERRAINAAIEQGELERMRPWAKAYGTFSGCGLGCGSGISAGFPLPKGKKAALSRLAVC